MNVPHQFCRASGVSGRLVRLHTDKHLIFDEMGLQKTQRRQTGGEGCNFWSGVTAYASYVS